MANSPSFTLHHTAHLRSPLPAASSRIFTATPELIRELCLASPLAIPSLYEFHSIKRGYVELPPAARNISTVSSVAPAEFLDLEFQEIEDGEGDGGSGDGSSAEGSDGTLPNKEKRRANVTEASFSFTEAVSMLCGMVETRPKIKASWLFFDGNVVEEEDGSGEVQAGKKPIVLAIYRSQAESAGAKVRVIKVRKLVPNADAKAGVGDDEKSHHQQQARLEQSCSVWCPWGTGWWTQRITDDALKNDMRWTEDLFRKPVA